MHQAYTYSLGFVSKRNCATFIYGEWHFDGNREMNSKHIHMGSARAVGELGTTTMGLCTRHALPVKTWSISRVAFLLDMHIKGFDLPALKHSSWQRSLETECLRCKVKAFYFCSCGLLWWLWSWDSRHMDIAEIVLSAATLTSLE